MDFFYFGLSFYHLKTVIVGSPKLVAVHNLEEYSQCADMVKTIKDDLRQLENSEMGGKGKGKWKGKVGKFVEVSLTNSCVVYTSNMLPFQLPNSPSFWSVRFSRTFLSLGHGFQHVKSLHIMPTCNPSFWTTRAY